MFRTGIILGLSFTAIAQAQFEVASVKPSGPRHSESTGMRTGKGRITANELTLKRYIMGAYGLGQNEILGGPDWVATDRFDIIARAEQPVEDAVLDRMLQMLLADRFKLVIHRESRVMPAYVITIGKNGPKLPKAAGGEASTNSGRNSIEVKNTTLDAFAQRLGPPNGFPCRQPHRARRHLRLQNRMESR